MDFKAKYDPHADLHDIGLLQHLRDLTYRNSNKQVDQNDANDGNEQEVDDELDGWTLGETHFGGLGSAQNHDERLQDDATLGRVSIRRGEFGLETQTQVEADEDEQKYGEKLCRVNECAPKGEHIQTDDAQLLDEKREDYKGGENGHWAALEFDDQIGWEDSEQGHDVREYFEKVLCRAQVG